MRFYERHNPAKLETVDVLLDRCGAGNEEALLTAIEAKYTKAAEAAAAGAAEGAAAGEAGGGPREPTTRDQIEAIYRKHNPSKLPEVERLLAKCAGSEDALLTAIRRKYEGPAFDGDVCDLCDSDDAGPRSRTEVSCCVLSTIYHSLHSLCVVVCRSMRL